MDRTDFAWDLRDPLSRGRRETPKAHQALVDYERLGAGRSLRKLHERYRQQTGSEPATRRYRTIADWSVRFQWQARLARLVALRWQVREQARVERIGQELDDELEDAHRLRQKGRKILESLPVVETVESSGGQNVVRRPASSSEYNAARGLLVEAAKLAREALGLTVSQRENVYLDWDWRAEVVSLIVDGAVDFGDVASEFGESLARRLYEQAGISVVDPPESQ